MSPESNFQLVVDDIQKGKCVVFLGPEVCLINGETTDKALVNFLRNENSSYFKRYYPDDDLYLFEDNIQRENFFDLMRTFYLQVQPGLDIYKKLACIPFHAYISIAPDLYLKLAFEKSRLIAQPGYYHKGGADVEPTDKPTADAPWVYNLFGVLDESESLILSHGDLFLFVKRIFGEKSLPDALLEKLQSATRYILIGFDFEKWYVQLILSLFGLHDPQTRVRRFASNRQIDQQTKEICSERFRIEFVNNNCEDYIDHIYNECKKRSLLRTPKNDELSGDIGEIDEYVKKNDLENAVRKLSMVIKDDNQIELLNNVILLESSLSEFRRKERENLFTPSDLEINRVRIANSILQLKDEAKRLATPVKDGCLI